MGNGTLSCVLSYEHDLFINEHTRPPKDDQRTEKQGASPASSLLRALSRGRGATIKAGGWGGYEGEGGRKTQG